MSRMLNLTVYHFLPAELKSKESTDSKKAHCPDKLTSEHSSLVVLIIKITLSPEGLAFILLFITSQLQDLKTPLLYMQI